ncbi:MAG: TetR family transcriptional regulator [Bdellovibrionota bacterium]|nr:TetR family transcriptional regulator [Bdellovibrionota bacterium]
MGEEKGTKEKILQVAAELFAKFGFAGTSVRDIAQKSGVNLSAVNYHFGSKHNLYWSTVCDAHNKGECEVNRLVSESKDLTDFAIRFFDFILSNKPMFRSIMKLMLTDGVPDPDEEVEETIEGTLVPIGSDELRKFIREQMGDISEESVSFMVTSIFGLIIHFGMMHSSSKIEMIKDKNPFIREENVRKAIAHNIKAVQNYVALVKGKF